MELDMLPPSVNQVYVNSKSGGRFMSEEGKSFKQAAAAHFLSKHRAQLLLMSKDAKYSVTIKLYFPDLENKTWPKTAKTRYKRLDASNHVKVLEDVIAAVTGVDDSNTFRLTVEKYIGTPHTVVIIEEMELWKTDSSSASATPQSCSISLLMVGSL